MSSPTTRFHLYRYQLLPSDRHHFQPNLYGVRTVEELLGRKNEFLREILVSSSRLVCRKREVPIQLLSEAEDLLLFQLAPQRSIRRETADFKTEVMDNWPRVLLLVWNSPDKQLVAVQHRPAAFQSSDAVVRSLFDSIEVRLSEHSLVGRWEAVFEKKYFWDLAKRYEGRIQEINFDLTTPNMASISRALSEELREFAKSSNAVSSSIGMKSSPDKALRVVQGNATLDGLVEYSSQGGGDIALRVVGMKKRIRTSSQVKEFSCEEAELKGDSASVLQVLKRLLP